MEFEELDPFFLNYDILTNFFSFLLKANSVLLGPEFKLVFSIRPRSLTGILIHVGSRPGRHLCVYLEAGKVRTCEDRVCGFHCWRPQWGGHCEGAGFHLVLRDLISGLT